MGERYRLLTEANPKTRKGEALGWKTLILHLLPFNYSGHQVCPMARGCEKECLAWAGRGHMSMTINARTRRTHQFFEDRERFMQLLELDILTAKLLASFEQQQLAIRLNGTSDIAWEKIRIGTDRNLMTRFPDIMFYDYTKIPGRTVPDNYRLVFSADDHNEVQCRKYLAQGQNVAKIFKGERPDNWLGHPVIDGDEHDLRFLDSSPVIVGLKLKQPHFPIQFQKAA